jgi:hypothetical protein
MHYFLIHAFSYTMSTVNIFCYFLSPDVIMKYISAINPSFLPNSQKLLAYTRAGVNYKSRFTVVFVLELYSCRKDYNTTVSQSIQTLLILNFIVNFIFSLF